MGETSVWSLGEAIPLEKLLTPPADAAPDSIRLSTHEGNLAGWVEQGSPCCAAASIAGAFNSLRKLDAQGEAECGATQARDVLPLLQDLVRSDLAERRVHLARTLNLPRRDAAPLSLLMSCVESWQARKGRPLTGRKELAVTPKELRQTLRELAALPRSDAEGRALHEAKQRPSVEEADERALWTQLRWGKEASEAAQLAQAAQGGHCAFSATHSLAPAAAATAAPATALAAAPAAVPAAAPSHETPATSPRIDLSGGAPADAPPAGWSSSAFGRSKSGCPSVASALGTMATSLSADGAAPAAAAAAADAGAGAGAGAGAPIREEAALVKLAQAHAGWVKISHEEAPSTAAVGNTHILAAAAKLSASLSDTAQAPPVIVRKLCGTRAGSGVGGGVGEYAYGSAGGEYDWLVNEDDSAELVEMQWHRLWRAFEEPDTVLLAHCTYTHVHTRTHTYTHVHTRTHGSTHGSTHGLRPRTRLVPLLAPSASSAVSFTWAPNLLPLSPLSPYPLPFSPLSLLSLPPSLLHSLPAQTGTTTRSSLACASGGTAPRASASARSSPPSPASGRGGG